MRWFHALGRWLWHQWIALDIEINEMTGGDQGETLSERGRESDSWFATHVLRHFAGDNRPKPDEHDGEDCDEPGHVNVC